MIKLDNISFDHCIKCTVCTVYCPVARVSPLFPGPKQSGPDTERLRIKNPELVDDSLKYCSNCKRCEVACPSDVRIADIIQDAKWKYWRKRTRPRDFFLSRTDLIGRMATTFSRAANAATGQPVVKFFLDRFIKIPGQRSFPAYESGTFSRWFRTHAPNQSAFRSKAVYFHGCNVNYNDHGLGRDVLRVLNALGVGLVVTHEKCCGVPLIANGYLGKAAANARHNIDRLGRALKRVDGPVISASSTCTFALKHEYKGILEQDDGSISGRVEYVTRYVNDLIQSGRSLDLNPVKMKVAYHSPCHLERMGGVVDTIDLLRMIPGLDLRILHSECCGISGTYGFKKELYDISQQVGSELFKKIDSVNPDVVVTDCETCKWQIEMSTPYKVLHPINLLAKALTVSEG